MNLSEVVVPSVKWEHLLPQGCGRGWGETEPLGPGPGRCVVNSCFSVYLQLCEDLFSRVNKNESAQLSYSVEVSVGLGGAWGGHGGPQVGWGQQ